MRIISLAINNFRLFKNTEFFLGKYMTIFSGTNAVGKSTLLGILGNSSELKVKDGKPIIQKQFRTEFSEIFKMSRSYDKTAPNVLTINFSDGSSRVCRITWQKKGKDKKPRSRLIPEYKENGKKHSAKQKWPTLFLGLSRLYPIGESDSEELVHKNIPIQNLNTLIDEYKKILSITDDIKAFQSISIPETSRKRAFGIDTTDYDYLSNSAGQDNLGQILLAVESFRRLKETHSSDYQGGLLLIDELDAALHPSAQIKLVKYLLKQAKALDLQIVYTTHSLSILSYAAYLIRSCNNSNLSENDTNIYYISKANFKIQVHHNPNYYTVKSLLEEDPLINQDNKIKVYTEDAEARWFLKNLSNEYATRIIARLNLLDTKIGKDSILSIVKGDFISFINKIVILDGDSTTVSDTYKAMSELNNRGQHILTLPGNKSPERLLFEFLISDSQYAEEYFLQSQCFDYGITKTIFTQRYTEIKNSRDDLKNEFNKYAAVFEETHLMQFWEKEYAKDLGEFLEELASVYSIIAKNLGLIPLN